MQDPTKIQDAVVAFACCALIAYYVLTIIATWRIFTKAGDKGWKALIPIYNNYMVYKISGIKSWFWIPIIFSFATSIVGSITNAVTYQGNDMIITWNPAYTVITIVSAAVSLIASIMLARNLAKVFKKGTGFAIGLFFLPHIFMMILGFGAAKYDKKALKK